MMETLLQDIHYGLRILWKSPAFTCVAVLTLALGIGANTAIFSVVDGILLAPLPFSNPDQLVSVSGTYPRGGFAAMRQQVRTLDVAAYTEGHEFNLTGIGEPSRLAGTLVSAEFFSVLGARPELGRTFYPGEDAAGQDNFVILSHALWQERFGSDKSVIGRPIEIEGVGRQILGVMPGDFRFPSAKTQVWLPLHMDPANVNRYWASNFMPVIGRLRPDATLQQAHAEIRTFQSHVGKLFPWKMPEDWNANIGVVQLKNSMVADVRTRLLMLLGAVAMILLIACGNVANLLLSRSAAREKEIGIRSALGAGRNRIARQLLTESVLLATLGGVCGLIFASAGLSLLKFALPAGTPRLMDVQMNWAVLAFTAGLIVLAGLIFGLAPALQSSRPRLGELLKAGRGARLSVSQRLRSLLAVSEVGLATMLVIVAGLLIRSFWALSHVDPGFQPGHIVTARITPNESFCSDVVRCLAFYRSVLEQTQAAPGVSGAALVNTLPLGGRVAVRTLAFDGLIPPPAKTLFWLNVVTPDYFRVMGIPVREGIGFTRADESGNSPVVVVTEETAQRFWPGQSAVGKHIRFPQEMQWRPVVGVIS
ncbi:MAG TPA: ABC transporter permease, partial [Terriglobales bacterium]|nr:ABC transporter permease [Terriglobales bacterium]